MFGSKETSEKLVQFSRSAFSKRKFVFHFNKTIFDTTFTPSQSFSVKGTDFTNGKRDSGTKFTSLEFCLPSAHVYGKQPLCEWKMVHRLLEDVKMFVMSQIRARAFDLYE